MAHRNGMYGRKISRWLLHSGLLLVIAGAIVSWLTVRSDRVFLRVGEPLQVYGMVLENSDGLCVDGRPSGLKSFSPVRAGEWKLQYLSELPDGTMVIELRSDPIGEPMVFAGYAMFALGSLWFIGLLPLLGVVGAVLLISLYHPTSPALNSPWFAVHVGLIAASYLCFLILPFRCSTKLLACGICLLGLAIASGSVWASSAWGRYWAWDPKETSALVLLSLYCLPLHISAIAARRWIYWCLLLLLPLLMFLPGLHSYLF